MGIELLLASCPIVVGRNHVEGTRQCPLQRTRESDSQTLNIAK